MTTETAVDAETVERLSSAFHRIFETFDDEEGVLAPDVFADLLPPFWRFQLQGSQTLLDQVRSIAAGRVTVEVVRVVPTVSGFVSETVETDHGPPVETARHLWLCEIRDGQIAEILSYCNGGWDDELRARHAAEAPMLRP